MFSKAARVRDTRDVERLVWNACDAADTAAQGSSAASANEAARAEAERQAFADGYAKGAEATTERVKDQLGRLAETVEQLASLRSVIIREAEQQLVVLAAAIAGRILRSELSTEPTRLLAIARAAIERLGERTQASVHLNPGDHAAISASSAGAQQVIRIVPDPAVQPGGCLVQSELGTVEAGVAAQLEELTAMLLDDDLPAAKEGNPGAEFPAA